uniref:Putative secreted protein n=1 Tax=Psorophora albipes TaxID=869069 RepID=T1D5D6_9DIPT
MEIITRTLRLVLLVLVASILIAEIECAPSRQQQQQQSVSVDDGPVQHLSRDELRQLFQRDAKWASSSNSHSADSHSDEWKASVLTNLKKMQTALGMPTESSPLLYRPMPYKPVFEQNSVQ